MKTKVIIGVAVLGLAVAAIVGYKILTTEVKRYLPEVTKDEDEVL